MKDAMRAIRQRISVRSYSPRPVDEAVRTRLGELFLENGRGPFGNPVRFRLLDLEAVSREEQQRLGTYGVIKGARLFILAAARPDTAGLADLGYCLEKIILEATAMGLATCWLGGTFRRRGFAARMELAPGEILPAITPVGYPAGAVSAVERIMRFGAGSRRRKQWAELFFHAGGRTPLREAEAGPFREALEAVRLAPSASNRQPWRLVRESEGFYHLYLQESRLYNRVLPFRIQDIDMGIAMCNFALVAEEKGLAGSWCRAVPPGTPRGLEYVATWKQSP